MDIKDLMVGDWIMSRRYSSPSRVYATYLYIQVGQPDITIINEEKDGSIIAGHSIEELTPIPLTQEILEKNGFKKDIELNGCYWRPDCRKYCIVKEMYTWYFAFRHMGGGHICISECNYVHELQHALRLCKVDKEVIL